MKDKKCSTKGCKILISSGMNKSGLCTKCSSKKWKLEHKKETAEYTHNYWLDNKDKYQPINQKSLAKWRKENPERVKEWGSDYYDKYKDKHKKYSKQHYEDNKKEVSKRHLEYANRRYREAEGFRIRKQLGSALSMVIRVYIKTGKIRNPMKKFSIDWVGIIEVLSPIPKNRSDYQVDHIVPLYKFDLTNIEQIQLAFAPENHRWLLTKENQGRGRKA